MRVSRLGRTRARCAWPNRGHAGESEVEPGEQNVAKDDGDSGEDSYAKETKDVRRARRGRKMSQFAGGRKDDEVAADDDAT